MKVCSKCKVEKSLDEFHKDRTSKDGLSSACGTCRMLAKRRYNEIKVTPLVPPKRPLSTTKVKPTSTSVTDERQRSARRRALVRLVRRHRAEFDALFIRETKRDVAS